VEDPGRAPDEEVVRSEIFARYWRFYGGAIAEEFLA